MISFMTIVGRMLLNFIKGAGEFGLFLWQTVTNCIRPPFYPREFAKQALEIGYYSMPVVGMTMLFAGMVFALQMFTGLGQFRAESAVAYALAIAIVRELGPVMAGLMVAGRIGASMAAEIGTMRVTEQIDALETLATNPFRYLVAPRVIAGTLMLPVLVFVGDIIGIYGGYLISVHKLDFNFSTYIQNTYTSLDTIGVVSGLVKAAVFGFVITLMGCYYGYTSEGGAKGVGSATTRAVVSSSIMILILNYIITELFFSR